MVSHNNYTPFARMADTASMAYYVNSDYFTSVTLLHCAASPRCTM